MREADEVHAFAREIPALVPGRPALLIFSFAESKNPHSAPTIFNWPVPCLKENCPTDMSGNSSVRCV